MKKQAVILLSGGLDSATVAATAISQGYNLYALSFRYGQKHQEELNAVKKIIKFFNQNSEPDTPNIIEHNIIDLDPSIFLNSSLINDINVPKNRNLSKNDIPNTYVPARNIIFLSYATAYAESRNICNIFIGANEVDYSGYPDCRPKFLSSFEDMINIGTKLGQEQKISVIAPLLHLTKAEIIKKGLELKLDYSITHSCYDPIDGYSCGQCDSCRLRLKGFKENNITDPIKYLNIKQA